MKSRIMNRYEVIGLLGSGAIGQVYAARDQALGRPVAIKALRSEYRTDRTFLERFHAEAASLARLSHPNIATLYDLQSDGQRLYMIMELVQGHTLEAVLAKMRRLNARDMLAVTTQIIAGLGYAHRMGVIHRDIKPSNLMLTGNGTLKIMDFGIARVRGSQRLTRSGNIVGTLAYVSPEQIKGGEGDERGDLYSLACVVYEMLSGDPPFNANTEYELIKAQVERTPQPIRVKIPHIPSDLDAALQRALAKDPAERFGSVEEFGRAIGAHASSGEAAEILLKDVLPLVGQAPAPVVSTEVMPALGDGISVGDAVTGSRSSQAPRRIAAKGLEDSKGPKSLSRPVVVLSGATILVVAVFGYIAVSSWWSNPPPGQPSTMASVGQSAVSTEGTQDEAATLPYSSFILPPPGSQTLEGGDISHGQPASASRASPPVRVARAVPNFPQRDESPAYSGQVVDWPGPNLIVVPLGTSFGLKFLKLYGILDASSGQAQANADHQKMKHFLAAAGNEVVCYARGDETYQCYAGNQDIALWALKSGYAKPSPDAPNEYLEARH